MDTGQEHDLLRSYLTDRDQQTCILRETSDIKRFMYGVPQGSVLGPLLFLLYINDIIKCLEDPNDAELVLYADDTNIFVISNDRSSAVTKANNVLNNINNFMKSNLLHINIKKSCYIHFVPRYFRNKNKNKNNFDNNESTDDLIFHQETQTTYYYMEIILMIISMKAARICLEARRISIPSISIARFKRNLKSILLQVQNAFDYIIE